MKISIDWLNAYLEPPAEADQVDRVLTDRAFPVEGRDPVGDGDQVLDVEVTSNRPDCLSHVGLAREVAAGLGCGFRHPECELPPPGELGPRDVGALTSVTNDCPDLCGLYTARVIQGVTVGPSPPWLTGRLGSIGLRSVNNVVDVTNFVLQELGQPLHAFDLGLLREGRIVVRRAADGEAFEAIDGSKHELRPNMLVIADGRDPVAIAGVMGGLKSEVSTNTTDVLLESAMFDALSVRCTSRALKLFSDSSYRFERGVDPEGVEAASRRAAALIAELAGGHVAPGVVRVGADPPPPRTVTMRTRRCRALLGIEVSTDRMIEVLGRLGLGPSLRRDAGEALIDCVIPSFRLDLGREVDLIEEVGRMHGFEHIPVQEKIHIVARPKPRTIAARQALGLVLTGHGYHEAATISFLGEQAAKPFVPEGMTMVRVDDAARKSEAVLRPSILPSLLACRKSNQDVGNTRVALYEVAATWARANGRIVERNRLALLHDADDGPAAYRGLRGPIDELAQALEGSTSIRVEPVEAANLSSAGRVLLDTRDLGVIGIVSDRTRELFGLQGPVVVAELDTEPLLGGFPPPRRVQPLARYPAIERDVSVVLEDPVPWAAVHECVQASDPARLEALQFIGVYRGKPVPPGKKSLTFRMVFRDPQDTLRHAQVDKQVGMVVERLAADLGAKVRE